MEHPAQKLGPGQQLIPALGVEPGGAFAQAGEEKILPAPRPSRKQWELKSVAQLVAIFGGAVTLIATVIVEAVRLDTAISSVSDDLKQVSERVSRLLEGEAKRDGQLQDIKSDVNEVHREVMQERMDSLRGSQPSQQLPLKQQQPAKKP